MVSECAIHVVNIDKKDANTGGVCTLEQDRQYYIKFLKDKYGITNIKDGNEVVKVLLDKLNLSKESEIWENNLFKQYVGDNLAQTILQTRFKTVGPTDSTDLLTNFNIDDTLNLWSIYSKRLFNKKFYHMQFQMIDFLDNKTDLALLDIEALKREGYNCFAVVLNTDISTGRGKHWFCIYGDLNHTGNADDPYHIEYFNSSGFSPPDPVVVWMELNKHNMLKKYNKHCINIKSMKIRVQHSNTECGMWSLMYILTRLQGKPPDYFIKAKTSDKDMIELRKYVFRPE